MLGPALEPEGREPYVAHARQILLQHDVEIVGWRSAYGGAAPYALGRRAVEVPRLEDARALFVLAHEVAHHVLDHASQRTVWLAEIEATDWAVAWMKREGIASSDVMTMARDHVTDACRRALNASNRPAALFTRMAERLPSWLRAEQRRSLERLANARCR